MKISVSPLYPTSNYLNIRIGIEQDFPDTHNIEDAVNVLWNCATAIHMKRYPHLYSPEGKPLYEGYKGEEEMKGTHVRNVVEEPVDKIQSWKTVISMCTSITALERFKPQVDRENNEDLTLAYIDKFNELTNQ